MARGGAEHRTIQLHLAVMVLIGVGLRANDSVPRGAGAVRLRVARQPLEERSVEVEEDAAMQHEHRITYKVR